MSLEGQRIISSQLDTNTPQTPLPYSKLASKVNYFYLVLSVITTFGVQFAIYKQIKSTISVGSGKGKDIMSMGKSKMQIFDQGNIHVKFKDVAGLDEAK
jgi:ATP-dependent Zn protease